MSYTVTDKLSEQGEVRNLLQKEMQNILPSLRHNPFRMQTAALEDYASRIVRINEDLEKRRQQLSGSWIQKYPKVPLIMGGVILGTTLVGSITDGLSVNIYPTAQAIISLISRIFLGLAACGASGTVIWQAGEAKYQESAQDLQEKAMDEKLLALFQSIAEHQNRKERTIQEADDHFKSCVKNYNELSNKYRDVLPGKEKMAALFVDWLPKEHELKRLLGDMCTLNQSLDSPISSDERRIENSSTDESPVHMEGVALATMQIRNKEIPRVILRGSLPTSQSEASIHVGKKAKKHALRTILRRSLCSIQTDQGKEYQQKWEELRQRVGIDINSLEIRTFRPKVNKEVQQANSELDSKLKAEDPIEEVPAALKGTGSSSSLSSQGDDYVKIDVDEEG